MLSTSEDRRGVFPRLLFALQRRAEMSRFLAMSDLSMRIKSKILAALDSDSSVTSLVPSWMIFPMKVDAGALPPLIRYGAPEVTPYEDWCGEGSTVEVTLHCFGSSETQAQMIAAAVESCLSSIVGVVGYSWIRTQFRQDTSEANVS